MSDKKNEFEKLVSVEIEDVDSLTIAYTSNKVLIEFDESEVEETVGGIYTKGVKEHAFAKNTVRRGKVIKTCERIVPTRNEYDFTMWQTEIQIIPGDEVWINYFDMLNSYSLHHDDTTMKLIPYTSIICAVRDGEVIMCNGYTLLEDYEEEEGFGDFTWKEKMADQGIIRYIGQPNEMYYLPIMERDHSAYIKKGLGGAKVYGRCDGHLIIKNKSKSDPGPKQLKVGDRVLIGEPKRLFYLEEWAYARFDNRKLYRVCQQYNIIAVFN